jgi:hypothetical protein
MTDKPKRPRDANQLAHMIAGIAIGEVDDTPLKKAVGQRKGGLKGGKARADKLSTDQRVEIAKKAASVRWGKDEAKS